jgi:hypothetical protein
MTARLIKVHPDSSCIESAAAFDPHMHLGSSELSGAFDEGDRVLNGHDLFGGIVRDLAAKFFLERHDQFHRIEAIRPKIIDETSGVSYLNGFDAQMLDDNSFNLFGDITHIGFP